MQAIVDTNFVILYKVFFYKYLLKMPTKKKVRNSVDFSQQSWVWFLKTQLVLTQG
mgnify:CR=1 FL=1